MNTFIASIIEAWEELRINRHRVILSLIGVGAAVWAMATVLALGSIISESMEYFSAHWSGRPGTVSVSVGPKSGADDGGGDGGVVYYNGVRQVEGSEEGDPGTKDDESSSAGPDGRPEDKFGQAVEELVKTTGVTYWTRQSNAYAAMQAPGMASCYIGPYSDGGGCSGNEDISIMAVDPGYFTIYYHDLIAGRFLTPADAQLQMNPVVINESTWEMMGKPDVRTYPRMRMLNHQEVALTVVGVSRNVSIYDSPEIYVNYDGFRQFAPTELLNQAAYSTFVFIAPPGEEKAAGDVVVSALGGQLGDGYEVTSSFDESRNEGANQQLGVVTAIISVIGGIVILLGALGLLTVSIVTIQQRVREIGIRRAMGASARRVFFSVFLESVVATTVAGLFGVAASILTIRFMPPHWLDLPAAMDNVAYPLSAAFLGVLISAFVGALCGVIPAWYAVRIKPIDAIRY